MKSKKYLKPAEHQKLFSNILQLENFHRLLVVKLNERMENLASRQETICQLFVELVGLLFNSLLTIFKTPQMEIYKDYIGTYDANFLIAMMDNHKRFSKYVMVSDTLIVVIIFQGK